MLTLALACGACGDDAAVPDAAVPDAALTDAEPDARPPKPPPVADPRTTLAFGHPGASGAPPTTMNLAYVDVGGVVHDLRLTGATWSHLDVSALSQLDHAAEQVTALHAEGQVSLVVRFSDGSFTWVWQRNGQWDRKDLSYDARAVPGTTRFAAVTGSLPHVVYGGTDGALHSLRVQSGTPSVDEVVTGAPAPTGPIAATYDGTGLYAGAGGQPTTFDFPTVDLAFHAPAGAPAMVGRGGIGWHGEGQEAIVYRDAVGAIHVGRYQGPMRTLEIGAPAAASDLATGEARGLPVRLAAVYRSAAGAPIVLERSGVATWTFVDLVAAADAPAATGDPVVSYDSAGTRLFVAYVGTDDHLHVLVRAADVWTDTDVTVAAP